MPEKIQNAVAAKAAAVAVKENQSKQSVSAMLNTLLDKDGYKKRFEELLGNRAPQFVSSIVSLVNADVNMQKVFYEAPVTIIQSALRAATYDLPIDPSLGYAYIMPFNNSIKQPDGSFVKRMEAAFVMGYKGMNQLALRTGVYKTINVIDVREGELKKYNRLTEEIELEFIEDDDVRDKKPIIGWCGYFRLINGTEKTIYMTRKQIEAHERKNRKGQYMTKGWREDFDSMAAKTVFRRLIGKWGLMSIDYQSADAKTVAAADAIAKGIFDDDDTPAINADYVIDDSMGAIVDNDAQGASVPGDWANMPSPESLFGEAAQ